MSKQESERLMQESTIPVPVGDEVVTYRGKMIEIVTQQMRIGSTETVYERARRSPGTRLLITSPDHNILLTREYRGEVGRWDYRLPGGKVFDSLEEYSEAVRSGVDLLEKSKEAAQKEAEGLISRARLEAERIEQEIIRREKELSERYKQGVIVNARLKAKNALLASKQELIDAVFEKAAESLVKGKFNKQVITHDKTSEAAEDSEHYLEGIRY